MKRFFAALLCVVVCISALAAAPFALAEERITMRTPLSGSTWAKIANIEIATRSLNGVTIPFGETFSFNDIVGPRTTAYGYQTAPNGRGAKVTGGGVAQAATTLYLALCQLELDEDIEFTDLETYGSRFKDNYVSSGSDAILVDETSGIDFTFINYAGDMTIEMWMTDNYLYCELTITSEDDFSFETEDYADGFYSGMPSAELVPAMQRPIASASFYLEDNNALRDNIILAASSINDTVLAAGDLFSFNDSVGPRLEKYGYQSAVNGRGATVTGGGVAQVASVIWLASKDIDNIVMVEKSTYGSRYNQNYVANSNDAILVDYNAGRDFSFRNAGDTTLTLSVYVSGDQLICDIFEN